MTEKDDSNNTREFYLENGLYVFTEYYLLKPGYCCGNQCRHCPYEPKHQKGNTQTPEKSDREKPRK